jgi:hypothetical protein
LIYKARLLWLKRPQAIRGNSHICVCKLGSTGHNRLLRPSHRSTLLDPGPCKTKRYKIDVESTTPRDAAARSSRNQPSYQPLHCALCALHSTLTLRYRLPAPPDAAAPPPKAAHAAQPLQSRGQPPAASRQPVHCPSLVAHVAALRCCSLFSSDVLLVPAARLVQPPGQVRPVRHPVRRARKPCRERERSRFTEGASSLPFRMSGCSRPVWCCHRSCGREVGVLGASTSADSAGALTAHSETAHSLPGRSLRFVFVSGRAPSFLREPASAKRRPWCRQRPSIHALPPPVLLTGETWCRIALSDCAGDVGSAIAREFVGLDFQHECGSSAPPAAGATRVHAPSCLSFVSQLQLQLSSS